MAMDEKQIINYLNESKTIVLATVDSDNRPLLRTIGGFAVQNLVTYFATAKNANKVKQIEKNNNISLLFEHENQVIPKFINISINAVAEKIDDNDGFLKATEIITKRRPQLKINQDSHNIYKIQPKEIIILDFSKEKPKDKVQIIKF